MRSTLPVRLLQCITRNALKSGLLETQTWRLIHRLRKHYGSQAQPIELETLFDDNIRVRASLDSHIEAQLFWQGFQEADINAVQWLKKLLPKDGVFIDVGANIGSFSLVAARHAPQGQIIAFEPSAYHLSRLEHNIALNNFNHVHVVRCGLSDHTGSATLHLPFNSNSISNTGGASLFAETREAHLETETIQLLRLDDYIESNALSRLDVIKLDIEGAELMALRGAENTLRQFRPHMIMEVDLQNLSRAGQSSETLLACLKTLDYEVQRIQASGVLTMVNGVDDLGQHQNVLCKPL